MPSAHLACENASVRAIRPRFLSLALPRLGHVDVTWNGTRGRSFFDHGYDLQDREAGEHEFWAGKLHVVVRRDHAAHLSRLTLAAMALVLANVAGWTEGHLWRLF